MCSGSIDSSLMAPIENVLLHCQNEAYRTDIQELHRQVVTPLECCLTPLQEQLSSPPVCFVFLIFNFLQRVLQIVICLVMLVYFAIVLSVFLVTASGYHLCILNEFFQQYFYCIVAVSFIDGHVTMETQSATHYLLLHKVVQS